MPPRKSTSRSSRASQAASSSKTTLLDAIPLPNLPESITPDYVPRPRERAALTEVQRGQLIHELVGFHPRTVLDDITDHAREEIYRTVGAVEGWAQKMADGKGDELEREVDIGLHALETLLESHIDKAFDKYTAWALRNTFEIPRDIEAVLPWHDGLDFERGQHVTTLSSGEDTLVERLEDLRTKVEQQRYLSEKLLEAEKLLDRRLDIAKQRKAEVGFVHEILSSSGLSPLPQTTTTLLSSLTALRSSLSTLSPDLLHPSSAPASAPPAPSAGSKAWELGRQAYLNWAVGKMVASSTAIASEGEAGGVGGVGVGVGGGGGGGGLEEVEKEMRDVSGGGAGREGAERLARMVSGQ